MSGARYDLEDRLVRFGAGICRLTEHLPASPVGKHVALQLIRSATSPLANYGEVQGAESRRDFVHKLGICLKELRETTRACMTCFGCEGDLDDLIAEHGDRFGTAVG